MATVISNLTPQDLALLQKELGVDEPVTDEDLSLLNEYSPESPEVRAALERANKALLELSKPGEPIGQQGTGSALMAQARAIDAGVAEIRRMMAEDGKPHPVFKLREPDPSEHEVTGLEDWVLYENDEGYGEAIQLMRDQEGRLTTILKAHILYRRGPSDLLRTYEDLMIYQENGYFDRTGGGFDLMATRRKYMTTKDCAFKSLRVPITAERVVFNGLVVPGELEVELSRSFPERPGELYSAVFTHQFGYEIYAHEKVGTSSYTTISSEKTKGGRLLDELSFKHDGEDWKIKLVINSDGLPNKVVFQGPRGEFYPGEIVYLGKKQPFHLSVESHFYLFGVRVGNKRIIAKWASAVSQNTNYTKNNGITIRDVISDESPRVGLSAVSVPDISSQGADNLVFRRVEIAPSEHDVTGLEDWVLFEHEEATGYGLAIKLARDDEGRLSTKVEKHILYRRLPNEPIKTYADLMANQYMLLSVPESQRHMRHDLASTRRFESNKAEISVFKSLQVPKDANKSEYKGVELTQDLLVSLTSSLPMIAESPVGYVARAKLEGEEYSHHEGNKGLYFTSEMTTIKYGHKNEPAFRAAYFFLLEGKKYQFVVIEPQKAKGPVEAYLQDDQGNRYELNIQRLWVLDDVFSDEDSANYLMTTRVGDLRISLAWQTKWLKESGNSNHTMPSWGHFAARVVTSEADTIEPRSLPRQAWLSYMSQSLSDVPEQGLKRVPFKMVDMGETSLDGWVLYEDVYGMGYGVAAKIMTDDHGQLTTKLDYHIFYKRDSASPISTEADIFRLETGRFRDSRAHYDFSVGGGMNGPPGVAFGSFKVANGTPYFLHNGANFPSVLSVDINHSIPVMGHGISAYMADTGFAGETYADEQAKAFELNATGGIKKIRLSSGKSGIEMNYEGAIEGKKIKLKLVANDKHEIHQVVFIDSMGKEIPAQVQRIWFYDPVSNEGKHAHYVITAKIGHERFITRWQVSYGQLANGKYDFSFSGVMPALKKVITSVSKGAEQAEIESEVILTETATPIESIRQNPLNEVLCRRIDPDVEAVEGTWLENIVLYEDVLGLGYGIAIEFERDEQGRLTSQFKHFYPYKREAHQKITSKRDLFALMELRVTAPETIDFAKEYVVPNLNEGQAIFFKSFHSQIGGPVSQYRGAQLPELIGVNTYIPVNGANDKRQLRQMITHKRIEGETFSETAIQSAAAPGKVREMLKKLAIDMRYTMNIDGEQITLEIQTKQDGSVKTARFVGADGKEYSAEFLPVPKEDVPDSIKSPNSYYVTTRIGNKRIIGFWHEPYIEKTTGKPQAVAVNTVFYTVNEVVDEVEKEFPLDKITKHMIEAMPEEEQMVYVDPNKKEVFFKSEHRQPLVGAISLKKNGQLQFYSIDRSQQIKMTDAEATARVLEQAHSFTFDEQGISEIHKGIYYKIDGLKVLQFEVGKKRKKGKKAPDRLVDTFTSKAVTDFVEAEKIKRAKAVGSGLGRVSETQEFSRTWFDALQPGDPGVFLIDLDGRVQKCVLYRIDSEQVGFGAAPTVVVTQNMDDEEISFVTIQIAPGYLHNLLQRLNSKPLEPIADAELKSVMSKTNDFSPLTKKGKPLTGVVSKAVSQITGKEDIIYALKEGKLTLMGKMFDGVENKTIEFVYKREGLNQTQEAKRDIPETGIENLTMIRRQVDPSDFEETGLENALIYEDGLGLGYGVVLFLETNKQGQMTNKVLSFTVYRRKPEQPLRSMRDLFLLPQSFNSTITEIGGWPLGIEGGLSVDGDRVLKEIHTIGAENYEGSPDKYPQKLVVDFRKRLPFHTKATDGIIEWSLQPVNGEKYSESVHYHTTLYEVERKTRTNGTQLTLDMDGGSGQWQLKLQYNKNGIFVDAYYHVLSGARVEATLIPIPDEINPKNKAYRATAVLGHFRVGANIPRQLGLGNMQAVAILQKIVEATPKKAVNKGAVYTEDFYRVSSELLDDTLDGYEVYESRVHNVGLVVRVEVADDGSQIMREIFTYRILGNKPNRNLEDLLKNMGAYLRGREGAVWKAGTTLSLRVGAEAERVVVNVMPKPGDRLLVQYNYDAVHAPSRMSVLFRARLRGEELKFEKYTFWHEIEAGWNASAQIDVFKVMLPFVGENWVYEARLDEDSGEIKAILYKEGTDPSKESFTVERLELTNGTMMFSADLNGRRVIGFDPYHEKISHFLGQPASGEVIIHKITNYEDVVAKRKQAKRQEQIDGLAIITETINSLKKLPEGALKINWPDCGERVQDSKKPSVISAEPLQISIVSMDAPYTTYRKFTNALNGSNPPQDFKVIMNWGSGAGNSEYMATVRKNTQGETEILLKPILSSGAPDGDFVFIVNTEVLRVADRDSELGLFLFGPAKQPQMIAEMNEDELVLMIDDGTFEAKLSEAVWSLWSEFDGATKILNKESQLFEIRIPLNSDLEAVIAKLNQTQASVAASLSGGVVHKPGSWQRYFEEKNLNHIELTTLPGESEPRKLIIRIYKSVNGDDVQYYIKEMDFRGLDPFKITHGFVMINGVPITPDQVTSHGIKIKEGDKIHVRHDTDKGFEDVKVTFYGDRLNDTESSFVSMDSQIKFELADDVSNASLNVMQQNGTLSEEKAIKLTFRVYEDYRSNTEPKPWLLKDVSLAFNFTEEELKILGFDLKTPIKLISYPQDMREGGQIVFEFGDPSNPASMGQMCFNLRWEDDTHQKIIITRSLELLKDEDFNFDDESLAKGRVVAKGRFRGRQLSVPMQRIRGKEGTRAFSVVHPDHQSAVNKALSLKGSQVDSFGVVQGRKTVISAEQIPQMDEDGRVTGTKIEFYETSLNSDGSRPVRSIYLTRKEYLPKREALDGIGNRHAERPGAVDRIEVEQPAFSIASELSIKAGDVFLPTPETLRFIESIYANFRSSKQSPYPDGYQLEQRLEFENEEGLVISVPVIWRHRSTNPFGLDIGGKLKTNENGEYVYDEKGVPVVEGGKRIETYIKGRPNTRRPVSDRFIAREKNGNWRFYAMAYDPEDGIYKAFNLNLLHYVFRDEDAGVSYVSPATFGMVCTNKETTEEHAAHYKKRGSVLLSTRIHETFSSDPKRQAMAEVIHVPQAKIESDGKEVRFAFGSLNNSAGHQLAEISGLKLDRGSYRLDFERTVKLTIKTVLPVDEIEEIEMEHSFSNRDRVVILREVLPEGEKREPRIFEWNLVLDTLVQRKYDTDFKFGQAYDKWMHNDAMELLRGLNIPVFQASTQRQIGNLQKQVVGEKIGATIRFENVEPPVIGVDETGYMIPDASQIESITDVDRIFTLLDHTPVHDSFFSPDEPTAIVQNLVGSYKENMTFVNEHGVIIQVPMTELTTHGVKYVFDPVPDPVVGMPDVRVLIPNPEYHDQPQYESLENKPYGWFDSLPEPYKSRLFGVDNINPLKLRDYQIEAVEAFRKDFAAGTIAKKGTVVLPTGSGKTRVMAACMAVAFVESVINGSYKDGDKFIVTTHLPDHIPSLTKQFLDIFGPVFRNLTGRALKVSSVSGSGEGSADVTGDVVILGTQKVTTNFEQHIARLKGELGENKIILTAPDETHHEFAPTWEHLLTNLQEISPNMYVEGFTATPKKDPKNNLVIEPNVLYQKSFLDQLRSGVLPNVQIMEVPTGQLVTSLERGFVLRNGHKYQAETYRTEINNPIRNRLVYKTIEGEFLRREDNPRALAPSKVVAHDIYHAVSLALGFKKYCEDGLNRSDKYQIEQARKNSMRARRVEALVPLIGEDGKIIKKINKADIQEAIRKKRAGEIDAIVIAAMGAGITKGARELYDRYTKNGTIELNFTVDLDIEGSDLYYLENTLIARPIESFDLLTQIVGRSTRRGPDDVDYDSGRVLSKRTPFVAQLRDNYGSRYVPTLADAYGFSFKLAPETRVDLMTGKPAKEVVAYFDVSTKLVHGVRLAGKDKQLLELQLGTTEHHRRYDLGYVGVRESESYGKRKIFGFNAKNVNKKASTLNDGLAELKELVEYYMLHADPGVYGETEVTGKTALSNGMQLDLKIEASTDFGLPHFVIKGVKEQVARNGNGFGRGIRTYIDYTDARGRKGQFDVLKPHNDASFFYLRDVKTGMFYIAIVDEDGMLCLWERRQFVKEFLVNASSVNFPMHRIVKAEHGIEYKNERKSYASRKPIKEKGSPYLYEITAVLGRQFGAHKKSASEHSITDLPKARFKVGVDKNGKLIVGAGEKSEVEIKNEACMPFSEGGEVRIEVHEETWVDHKTGKSMRGRVRVFLYKREFYELDDEGELIEKDPYAIITFENREALIGSSGKFCIKSAHYQEYHRTDSADKFHKMPDHPQFLTEGTSSAFVTSATHLFGDGVLQLFLESYAHDQKDLLKLYYQLRAVKSGSLYNVGWLMSVMSLLDSYEYLDEVLTAVPERRLLTATGGYNLNEMAELTRFALQKKEVKKIKRLVSKSQGPGLVNYDLSRPQHELMQRPVWQPKSEPCVAPDICMPAMPNCVTEGLNNYYNMGQISPMGHIGPMSNPMGLGSLLGLMPTMGLF